MTITIYGFPASSNVQKPLWVCGEIGLSFTFIKKGGPYGGLDDPEYLELNPNGRVPTVIDGDLVVWESAACARYLAARYGGGTIWPDDPAIRAEGDKWMDWHLGTLGPALKPVYDALIRTSPDERNQDALKIGIENLRNTISILDDALKGRKYVAGDNFSFGDISVGIGAYRWYNIPIDRPELPHLRDWYERLTERPAYQKYIMRPLS
jgi:glutathione S-transferase